MQKKQTARAARAAYIAVAALVTLVSGIFLYRGLTKENTQMVPPNDSYRNDTLDDATKQLLGKAEKLIGREMSKGDIPGLSITVIKNGETVYQSGFGYADLHTGEKATVNTLYQLGSNSKAFTAAGVYQLQKDGRIKLSDPVSKYIPWLNLTHQGKPAEVTVQELLHHTSGIPTSMINQIPQLTETDKKAIEKTVRIVKGTKLVSRPGSKFAYSTINYDLLGLLIETVSGISYEEYIQKNVLDPAGLANTYLYKSKAAGKYLSSGYRISFFSPRAYLAPSYEGNKPAGYILSSISDIDRWLKIQMGCIPTPLHGVIEETHQPDINVESLADGIHYASGWFVYDGDITEIFHGGKNPNYSSYIVFRPKDKTAVAVLCNLKSDQTQLIAQSVLGLFYTNENSAVSISDSNQTYDKLCSIVLFVTGILLLIVLYPFVSLLWNVLKKGKNIRFSKALVIKCTAVCILALAICVAFYALPYLALNRQQWSFLFIWYPASVKVAVYTIYALILISFVTVVLKLIDKANGKF